MPRPVVSEGLSNQSPAAKRNLEFQIQPSLASLEASLYVKHRQTGSKTRAARFADLVQARTCIIAPREPPVSDPGRGR
jgi:hypothetical protein